MFFKSFKHLLQDEVSCSLEIPISLCLLFKKEKKKKRIAGWVIRLHGDICIRDICLLSD